MGGETKPMMAPTSSASYPQLAARPKGKEITHIMKSRLGQFTNNGQYKQQSLMAKLYDGRLSGSPHIKLHVWSAPDLTRPTFDEATSSKNEYRKTHKGESFGPSWSTHWFRVQFTLPREWSYKPQVELHWHSGCEGMVWTEDGKPLQGISPSERNEWILPDEYRDYDKEHTIYIEMACNGMFGNPRDGDTIQPPDPNKYFVLDEADLVSVNLPARALYYDFWIIGDAAREFPEDGWEMHEALQVCNEIMDCFIAGEGSNECIYECRQIAKRYLGDKIDSAEVYDSNQDSIVQSIGNCHIDTCWLWPWAETKRKIARSWSNQCDLIDRYPELRFCASQAQQYKWLEKLYPYAFDRVKSKIKEGKFQTIGGSWVEHDTNMPSGESLVRQFLYGQRYFESKFGERCRTFWLPDTFGYSTQLPQLCRLAGMDRFFTQKLSWNNINNFPHTTFNWVSLDGSQVLCHMAPCETYTAEAHFGDVKRSVTNHKSMDQDATSLLPYGKGDGGGGPTYGHLEKLRRCRGMSDKVGRLPRVQVGNSVEDFFDRLEKKAATGETEFVTWYGELYLELHRGCYTTQANNKRNNRKAEILLHDIEYLATLATLSGAKAQSNKAYKYPKKELDFMWEAVLLCQFHDCLPGSTIEMCVDDANKLYAEVFETGEALMKDVMSALGFTDSNHALVPVNTLGWRREEVVQMSQAENGRGRYGVARTSQGHHNGLFLQQDRTRCVQIQQKSEDVFTLSNSQLDVELDHGVITSLYDKTNDRQVLPKGGKANQLVIFDDKPLYWQAWDVEVYHTRSRKELHAEKGSSVITQNTPECVAVTTTIKISDKSSIKTTISLKAWASYDDPSPTSKDKYNTPIPSAVEVTADVDWHETMKFLKVEFPTTITNTEASYETQYGIVRRPTHYNTTWDMAKFEVCCHRWADLSENGYGVSVLNDSKYGFATVGKLMRLSLLRAPKAPDAHADMGKHHIRWAVMPHAGGLDERTVRAGFNFNYPQRLARHPSADSLSSLMSAFKFTSDSNPSLVMDTVKRAEDDSDVVPSDDDTVRFPAKTAATKGKQHVILRIYDSLGGRSRGEIHFGCFEAKRAWRSNLLEDEEEEVEVKDGRIKVDLRAFEVQTIKVEVVCTE